MLYGESILVQSHSWSPILLLLRQYPRGLGENLLRAWERFRTKPRLDLRQKPAFDPQKTDLQIFQSLEDNDPWTDAKLPSLFLYLYDNQKLVIPNEWENTMEEMRKYMEQFVARHAKVSELIFICAYGLPDPFWFPALCWHCTSSSSQVLTKDDLAGGPTEWLESSRNPVHSIHNLKELPIGGAGSVCQEEFWRCLGEFDGFGLS